MSAVRALAAPPKPFSGDNRRISRKGRRASYSNPFIAEFRSRARELVESGLLDRAAQITTIAHDLTDAAIAAMEVECQKRGDDIAALRSLRSAAFEGIAFGIIHRIEKRRL